MNFIINIVFMFLGFLV